MPFSWWANVEDDRKGAVYDTVRIALLVGVTIRGGLLVTGISLMVVEGNFLLDWAMSLGLAQQFGVEDIEEVAIGTLIVVGIFLFVGIFWRLRVIGAMSDMNSRMSGNTDEP